MKVGVIGSGEVGQILANGFIAKGHDVVIGTRDPKGKKGAELSAAVKNAKLGTFAEAATHGDVVVLAVHGKNIEEAVKLAGPANLAGKLVLDTSNALDFGPNGAHRPANIPDSCMQVAQRAAPKALLVKAWNLTPGMSMIGPKQAGAGDQFICGDDEDAKAKATEIREGFGWRVCDVGDSSMAPYVEGAGLMVINWAARVNDWGWVLKVNGRKA